MIKLLLLIIATMIGCASSITTDNPTDPEADSPIVFGERKATPYGCIKWKIQSTKPPPLKPTEEEESNLPGWDC
jgi:uncharacterized protein YceK